MTENKLLNKLRRRTLTFLTVLSLKMYPQQQ